MSTFGTDDVTLAADGDDSVAGPAPGHDDAAPPEAIGRFRIESVLGRGGMGVVYAAHDPRLDRRVALKLVQVERGSRNPDAQVRLMREARAMARLSHPNVVPVYEVMEHEGDLAVAMELVDGEDLRSWNEHDRGWREIVRVLLQAGRGLAAAHAAGLVHRDFKPHNVLVGRDGRVRVTDFGLARAGEPPESAARRRSPSLATTLEDTLSEASIGVSLTRAGALIGTPAYIAPECYAGDPATAASDQFAFAVTAFEALYGQRPFPGDNIAAIASAMLEGRVRPIPSEPAVPRRIRQALTRALRPAPADRFDHIDELLGELEAPLRSRRWRVTLGVAATLGIGMAGWYAQATDGCPDPRRELAPTWSRSRADELRRDYEGSERPGAAQTWRHVAPHLDAWADAWIEARRDACEATVRRQEQTERDMDLRVTCLDQQRRRFGALVDQLATVDAATVEHAVVAVEGLGSPSECDDLEALRTDPVPPPPAEIATAVDDAIERLTAAHAMIGLGRFAAAEPIVARVVEEAEGLGYAPLLARAYRDQAEVLEGTGRVDEAIRRDRQAFDAALDARDDARAAAAAVNLAIHYDDERRDDAEARVWIQQAESLVRRHALSGRARCQTALVRARYHRERMQMAQAQAGYAEVERVCAEDAVEPSMYAVALRERAGFAARSGDAARGEELARASAEVIEAAFGDEHPLYAKALHALAVTLIGRGRHEQAGESLQKAQLIYRAVYGETHTLTGEAESGLATVAFEMGDIEGALEHLQRARSILSASASARALEGVMRQLVQVHFKLGQADRAREVGAELIAAIEAERGPNDAELASVLITLTNVEASTGHWEAARPLAARAERIIAGSLGDEHPNMAIVLQLRSQIDAALGDLPGGLAAIERAVAILVAAEGAPAVLASARMVQSQLLRELDRSDEARDAARLAHEAYEKAGPAFAAQRDQAAAWMRDEDGPVNDTAR